MSLIYLVFLVAFSALLLAMMLDSIRSLRSKPVWAQPSPAQPRLQLVETVDRRQQELPFVGVDRRQAGAAETADLTSRAA